MTSARGLVCGLRPRNFAACRTVRGHSQPECWAHSDPNESRRTIGAVTRNTGIVSRINAESAGSPEVRRRASCLRQYTRWPGTQDRGTFYRRRVSQNNASSSGVAEACLQPCTKLTSSVGPASISSWTRRPVNLQNERPTKQDKHGRHVSTTAPRHRLGG